MAGYCGDVVSDGDDESKRDDDGRVYCKARSQKRSERGAAGKNGVARLTGKNTGFGPLKLATLC